MNNQWTRYQKEFDYAKDTNFKDICLMIKELLSSIK